MSQHQSPLKLVAIIRAHPKCRNQLRLTRRLLDTHTHTTALWDAGFYIALLPFLGSKHTAINRGALETEKMQLYS